MASLLYVKSSRSSRQSPGRVASPVPSPDNSAPYLRLAGYLILPWLATAALVAAESVIVDQAFHHLRQMEPREWDHFPAKAEAQMIVKDFDLKAPSPYKLLILRQSNVKQSWSVLLNGRKLGMLNRDHNDLQTALSIPQETLKELGNRLEISTQSVSPDDIRVGEIALLSQTRDELANDGEVSVTVKDADTKLPLPCRLTIVDAKSKSMALLGAKSSSRLAVRPGVIYTLDGRARFGLQAGRYKIWAGRGFEYGLAESEIEVKEGIAIEIALTLRREVETPGLVACDTHLHTNEFARHGDATLVERLITLAGEGVELPISTEHDQHIDYTAEARRIGADKYYTPILGCEVTTKLGHFNSFPINAGSTPAQHRLRPWPQIFANMFATPGVKVVIMNHPRDVHAGFKPLDGAHYDTESGRFADSWELKANGIEVINSGAQKSDPMRPVHDWMALLRSGHKISAVGSSDSHTVNMAIVGQARTYIRCPDDAPSIIDINTAVDSFLAGRTHVSFGLLTLLGNTANGGVKVSVLGPGWSQAAKLTLFVDGRIVDSVTIPQDARSRPGVKFEQS